MNIKSLFPWIAILSFACSSLPARQKTPDDLLSAKDKALEKAGRLRGPALSSGIGDKEPWKSYNQWRCFSSKTAEVICVDEDDNGIKKVPTLSIEDGKHLYEFTMEVEPEPDCAKVSAKWNKLLKDEPAFCAFAALLPTDEESGPDSKTQSMWIIDRLKTSRGYWETQEEDNWAKD